MKKLLTLLVAASSYLHASTFDFVFDNDSTPGIQPPVVGTGTFNFSTDPGDGTFPIGDLGPFTMSFSFDTGWAFTEADILSDLSLVQVVFSTSGSDRRLQFSDTGAGSGGPFGGSLDLENSLGQILTFEPSYFGEGLRLYQAADPTVGYFGDYLALQRVGVPDGGATALLLSVGALALGFFRRNRN